MSRTASGPHKCSTVKSWRQKTKFPHLAPAHQLSPVSSFCSFLCCKEHSVCCLAVINLPIVLDAMWSAHCSLWKYPSGRFRFCTKSSARTWGGQKALISSHHCRAMTNVPLLICDKWWKAVDFSCKTRWTLSAVLPKKMLLWWKGL